MRNKYYNKFLTKNPKAKDNLLIYIKPTVKYILDKILEFSDQYIKLTMNPDAVLTLDDLEELKDKYMFLVEASGELNFDIESHISEVFNMFDLGEPSTDRTLAENIIILSKNILLRKGIVQQEYYYERLKSSEGHILPGIEMLGNICQLIIIISADINRDLIEKVESEVYFRTLLNICCFLELFNYSKV